MTDGRGPIATLRAVADRHPEVAEGARIAICLGMIEAEIERLRKIEEAAEFVCQNDMAGIVEDDAWARLRASLGIECAP